MRPPLLVTLSLALALAPGVDAAPAGAERTADDAADDAHLRAGDHAGRRADHRVFAAGDAQAPAPQPPPGTRLLRSEGGALFVPQPLPDGVRAAAPADWWMLVDTDADKDADTDPDTDADANTDGDADDDKTARLHVPDLPRQPQSSPWRVRLRSTDDVRLRTDGAIEHAHRFEAGRAARFALDGDVDEVRVEVRRDVARRSLGSRQRTALRVDADGRTVFDGLPLLPSGRRMPYRVAGDAVLLETVAEQRIALPRGTRTLTVQGEPGTFVRVLAVLAGTPARVRAALPLEADVDNQGQTHSDARYLRALAALPESAALLQLSWMGYYRDLPVAGAEDAPLRTQSALLRPLHRRAALPELHGADVLREPDRGQRGTLHWLPPNTALTLDAAADDGAPALYRLSVASPLGELHAIAAEPHSTAAERIPLALLDQRGTRIDLIYDPALAVALIPRAGGEDGVLALEQGREAAPVANVSRTRLAFADGRRPRTLRNLDATRGVWVRIERYWPAVAPLAQEDGQPALARLAAALREDLLGRAAVLREDRELDAASVLVRARRAAFLDQRCAAPERPTTAAEATAALALARKVGDTDPVLTRCALTQAMRQAGGPGAEAIADYTTWARGQARLDLITGLRAALAVDRDRPEDWRALAAALEEEGETSAAVWLRRVAHMVELDRPLVGADTSTAAPSPAATQARPDTASGDGQTTRATTPVPLERSLVPERSAGSAHIALSSRAAPQLRWRGTAGQPLEWRLPSPGRHRLELRASGAGEAGRTLRWVRIDAPGIGTDGSDSVLLPLIAPVPAAEDAAEEGTRETGGEAAAAGPLLGIVFDSLRPDVPLRVRPLPLPGRAPVAGEVLAELRALELPPLEGASAAAAQPAHGQTGLPDPAHGQTGLPDLALVDTTAPDSGHSAVLRWLDREGIHQTRLPLRLGLPAPDEPPARRPGEAAVAPADVPATVTADTGLQRPALRLSADTPRLDLPDGQPPQATHAPPLASEAVIEALWLHEVAHPDAIPAAGWALQRASEQSLSPHLRALRDRLRARYRWAPYRQIVSSAGQWLRPLADGQLRSPEFVARSALGGPLTEEDIVLAPGREWRLSGFAPGQNAALHLHLHAALPSAQLPLWSEQRTWTLSAERPLRIAVRADAQGEIALRLGQALPATYLRVRLDGGGGLRTTGTELYHLPPLRVWSPTPQALLITEWDGRRDASRVQWVGVGETALRGEALPGAALRVDALQPQQTLWPQAAVQPAAQHDAPAPGPEMAPPTTAPSATSRWTAADAASGRLHALVEPLARMPGAYLRLTQRRDVDADDPAGERFAEAGARWRLGSRSDRWRLRLDAFGRRHDAGMQVLGGEATLEWRAPEAPWEGSVQLRALRQPGTRVDGRTPTALRLRADIDYALVIDDRWDYTFTSGLLAHAANPDSLSRREALRVDSDLQSRYRIDHPQQPFIEQRLRWRSDWRSIYTGTLSLFGNAPGETRPDHLRLGLDWHRVGPRWVLNASTDWRHAFADEHRRRAFDRVRLDAAATAYRIGPIHGWRLRVGAGYDLRARDAHAGVLLEWFRHDGRGIADLLRSEVPLRGVLEHDLHTPLRDDGGP